ncbi:MAG: hypothetical protein ACREF3_16145 [Acetobacteraceae bacterium]
MVRSGILAAALLVAATTAHAGAFVNGGFETGDLSGWTQGSGYWYGGWPLNPADYSVGGPKYDASANANGIVTPGLDPRTDNKLNMVYAGNYSARANDSNNNYSVSTLTQSVNNYTDSHIYFAWAAVLQGSHGLTDSDNFTLTLTDDTVGTTLYQRSYNSASAAGTSLFTQSSTGWFYTAWQIENLDVSSALGHNFTLALLAADCPYGGHAGYIYLDGFGSVIPPVGVAEPASLALLGLGFVGLGLIRTRRQTSAAA